MKLVRLQTEYMGTPLTRLALNGVLLDITEDYMGAFFTTYGPVVDVSPIISKAVIATGDFVFQVIVTRESFLDITDTLTFRGRKIFVCRRTETPLLLFGVPSWSPGPQPRPSSSKK